MKKILIIGGAAQHSKLVEAAHRMGVVTYVVDYLPIEKAPAKQISDYHFQIDIFNTNAIVELCQKEGIDGALAAYLDSCQLPYQRVCERMGYPCFGNAHLHHILTDKEAFKKVCIENDVDIIPEYQQDDNNIEYPVLVKPAISRGSRGQTVCHNRTQLTEAIIYAKTFSDNNEVIIEKYMGQNNDLQLAYLVINRKPFLLRVEDRFTGSLESGLDKLCIATVAPSILDDVYRQNVTGKVEKMISQLGIVNAPVFIQGFMDGNKCRFYDPGLRLPGNDYDLIYKRSTGVDIPMMLVEFALTGSFPEDSYKMLVDKPQLKFTSMLFPDLKPGIIGTIVGEDVIKVHKNVVSFYRLYGIGDNIEKTNNLKQRFCEVDILCDSADELKETLAFIQNTLSVKDNYGNEMLFAEFNVENINRYNH